MGVMRLTITGHHLPGRRWCSGGEIQDNVHVAVQERREPVGRVPGDAESATWQTEVRVVVGDDGGLDFRGPVVQGRCGERFVYLVWGHVDAAGTFAMFRRAKLMLDQVDPSLVRAADAPGRRLVANVDLTDDGGGPRCARVEPPALRWTVE